VQCIEFQKEEGPSEVYTQHEYNNVITQPMRTATKRAAKHKTTHRGAISQCMYLKK
jgi:hypothetical protein